MAENTESDLTLSSFSKFIIWYSVLFSQLQRIDYSEDGYLLLFLLTKIDPVTG